MEPIFSEEHVEFFNYICRNREHLAYFSTIVTELGEYNVEGGISLSDLINYRLVIVRGKCILFFKKGDFQVKKYLSRINIAFLKDLARDYLERKALWEADNSDLVSNSIFRQCKSFAREISTCTVSCYEVCKRMADLRIYSISNAFGLGCCECWWLV